jgi:hypothetical protein
LRRALFAALVAGIAVAAASPAPAAGDALQYACDQPPLPRSAANCDGWHTAPVKLLWSWDVLYDPVADLRFDCSSPHLFGTDTAGTAVTCMVFTPGPPADAQVKSVTIQVDQTPPTVTGFTTDRPPDKDGWWNHPVGLQFIGTDATSGIAGCDAISYSGPDGPNVPVTGSCRDVAGNTAPGTFPIKYDATPPILASLASQNVVGHTTLNWTTSNDVVQTRIVRSPGIGAAPASEVYSGPDHTFTDTGVTGGRTYTYTLTASDQAANTATDTINVTAKASPQAAPANVQRFAAPPRLRWRRVKGADYYNVQLFRGARKILSVWPHRNGFQLKRTWKYKGRKRVLSAGPYHWYVWAGYGPRSHHRYGKLIAHRRFKITPAKAAR